MLLKIPTDGYEQWSRSFSSILGRFAAIFRASANEEQVGFLACRVRNLPAYFGGFPVGFVSEVYVCETYRRHGVGRKLIDAALDWFGEQGINRVELQVIVSNTDAIDAYRRLGWQGELYQMVWQRPGT
jgi:GNAT superfamily N-acetyltransferase